MVGVKGQVQRRGVERRRQIVDAAVAGFASNGFRGTGLAAIAEAVGVSPGTILHHFGSKEGLLEAVIQARDVRISARLASLADLGGVEALREFALVAGEVEADRRLASLFTVLQVENLDPEHAIHGFFVRRSRAVRRLLADILRSGVARGELDAAADVEALATEAVAFMEGAQVLWLLDPDRTSLTDLYRAYFDRLIHSLAAGKGGDVDPPG